MQPFEKVGVGLKGRVEWQVVSRDGRVRQAGKGPNLITDLGLDYIAQYGIGAGRNVGAPPTSNGQDIKSYCAVGTGSTAPATTDRQLVAEVARTSNLYQSQGTTTPSTGVFEISTYHEFGFGAAVGNLTEFGYSPVSSGVATMSIRALFRDGLGNPIVVTVSADEKLRIKHVLQVTISPTVATAGQFDIAGIGTITGQFLFNKTNSNAENFMSNTWGLGAVLRAYMLEAIISPVAAPDPLLYDTLMPFESSSPTKAVTSSYLAGSYKRLLSVSLGTGEANITHRKYSLQRAAGSEPGLWVFALDAASYYTKDNQHTLDLDLFEISWARA